jgi:hypothetical protein
VPGAPGMGGTIPEQELIQSPRPPYVADFFSPEATVELRQRDMEQGARVTPQVEFFNLPGR